MLKCRVFQFTVNKFCHLDDVVNLVQLNINCVHALANHSSVIASACNLFQLQGGHDLGSSICDMVASVKESAVRV